MKNKRVLIINPTGGSPYHGPNLRSYNLAKYLNEVGLETKIVSNAFFHKFYKLPKANNKINLEKIDGINYFWVKTRKYHGRGLFQIFNQIEFTLKLYFHYDFFGPKDFYDYIICSSPPPIAFVAAKKIASYHNAKLIFEIRDLWPLVIKEVGNFSSFNPYIIFIKLIEYYAVNKSDHIVSVKPGDIDYLIDEYNISKNKFSYVPNGYDTKSKSEKIIIEDLNKISHDSKIIGYAGSLSMAYSISQLIYAAYNLRDVKKLYFVLVGDGPQEKELKYLVENLKLENVLFLGRVSNKKIPNIVKRFTICFLGYKKSEWLKYGISSNKIYDYMFQKKPILAAVETNYNPIFEANCGLSVKPENTKEITDAILKLINLGDEKLETLGQNGYKYLLNKHSFTNISKTYVKIFNKI